MSPITNALSHFELEDDKGEKKEIIDKENKEREGAFGPPQSETKQYITSGHCLSTLQCQEVTQEEERMKDWVHHPFIKSKVHEIGFLTLQLGDLIGNHAFARGEEGGGRCPNRMINDFWDMRRWANERLGEGLGFRWLTNQDRRTGGIRFAALHLSVGHEWQHVPVRIAGLEHGATDVTMALCERALPCSL